MSQNACGGARFLGFWQEVAGTVSLLPFAWKSVVMSFSISVLSSLAYWIFLLNQISKYFSRRFKGNIFKDKGWLLG